MKHDYKLISKDAYIPQGGSHPSLAACMAWGTACAAIWFLAGYIALVQLGAI